MAAVQSGHTRMSPELAKFLAAEGEQGDVPSLDLASSLDTTSAPSLDITTSHFRLEGVDQELEQFRNHEVPCYGSMQ